MVKLRARAGQHAAAVLPARLDMKRPNGFPRKAWRPAPQHHGLVVDDMLADEPGPGADASPPAAGVQPVCETTSQAIPAPDPHGLAAAVFDEVFISPCEHIAMAHERLQRAMDDPRLVDLEAREFFEGRVARELADGWQSGHHLLWDAATSRFSWNTDPARLRCFGHAGHVLDAALVEQAQFERQPEDHQRAQRELIRRLRTNSQPQELDLVQNQRMLEWLLLAFPNWLAVMTDAREVTHWRQAHAALPVAYQSLLPAHPLPLDPQPAADSPMPTPDFPQQSEGIGRFPWWWLLFLVPVLGRCAG